MSLSRRGKVLTTFLVLFIAIATGLGIYVYQTVKDLPDIGDVKSIIKNQTTYIYASDGTLITRLFRENRTVVPLSEISTTMQQAVISVEDQRFYDHNGVDYIRIVGALIRDIKNPGRLQGASTITQQYVKNAYFSPEQTIERKLKEAFLATRLERNYTKQQILEKYLNSIYFGNGAYGVEAASQTYFGIPASKLNAEQSALLAGIIKGPTIYDPYKYPTNALKRRNLVLDLMADQGYITKAEAKALKVKPLTIMPKRNRYIGIAPYYVEWIKSELEKTQFDENAIYSQGLRIYTTLDPKMQAYAESAWKKYLPYSKDPDVAIVVIDPKTGAVKAMVGGKDFSKQKINVATQGTGRQPGSAFKPFVLTAAIMEGFSPDDGFNASSPRIFEIAGSKPWKVNNYSGESSAGYISLRKATALSVNVVYADLIMKVGPEKVVATARKLGIRSPLNPDPAIALGGLEYGVKPLEMANAYATFANNGEYNEAYGVEKIEMPTGEVIYKHKKEPKQVIDKAVAYLVNESLKGVIQGGTGTRARIGRPAAGKTGTTQKYVDAWFCGYTPDLAATVWVGYKEESKPMTNVHGIRVAGGTFPAQIWSYFMKKALDGVEKHDFDRAPKGSLTYKSLCDESNLIASEFCPKVSKHVYVKKYAPKISKVCSLHKPIKVPNLVGLTKDEAIKQLEELKLKSSVVVKQSDQPFGIVIEQVPPVDSEVKEGTIVEIAISGNPDNPISSGEGVGVPNVIGMNAEQATSNLESMGFVVSGEYRLSNEPQETVIGQRPPAGFIAQPGATITIVISGQSGSVTVPNVRGKSESSAKEILESNGFDVVVFNDTSSENIEKYGLGAVSNQDPAPRTKVNRGTRVVIYVTTQG